VSRSTRSDAAQLRKLEYFFRDEVDGEDLGRRGDYDDLTPVDTAIRAMRELVAMINGDRKITRAELRAIGARLGHSAQRFRIDTRPPRRSGSATPCSPTWARGSGASPRASPASATRRST
jgi:hypothetical protein